MQSPLTAMATRHVLDGAIGVVVLVVLTWTLYRPKIQQSERYQSMVVPLANIMDVGFLVLSPIIIVLVGYEAPLYMLGICLAAIVTGFVISYNIRHYEPLVGTTDRLHSVAAAANWSLFGASMVNIAYYVQLLMTLVLLPLDVYTDGRVTFTSVVLLVVVIVAGYRGHLPLLNRLGDRTTAFNLAALGAVLAAFAAYNVLEALAGRWDFPSYDPAVGGDDLRKLLGLFAMVQGFEASRYIGERFSGEVRISTMRWAQVIATSVFVALIAVVLLPAGQILPAPDATAIFVVSKEVSPYLPWLILVAAIGSQLSAITNATSSRSDLLMEATKQTVARKFTFPILLVPAIMIVEFTDVTEAVAIASRVFALYFVLQAVIAVILAHRKRNWTGVAGFSAIGLMMATVTIFGLPV
jgi:hypothetical protein